ncbi:hypothetical protein GOP47_0001422 [Adiantum capillus-veneris]|uniref:RRM domain-containing protein n=1 Tax=Adiantum capillus-veneris TaxID=13818 RepID=A0A9D4V8W9_ADICA|nr:hypothetical protein GOP47_0001422 [Adiantum capillus-veneris]
MAVADASSQLVNGDNSPSDLQQEEHTRRPAQQTPRVSSSSSPTARALVSSSPQQDARQKIENLGEQEGNPGHTEPPPARGAQENGFDHYDHEHQHRMRQLEEYFSKLNPHAKEFVPPSYVTNSHSDIVSENGNKSNSIRKKNGNSNKRRTNNRLLRAQWDDSIRRTVYVSDIDQQVTEEQLAALFLTCGQVVDCRVCGDPNSVLRFAFVEFTDEEGAHRALSLAGTMLGFYPVRVLPSKTAIVPVNPTFLPQSEDEREMCARTIYCTNIDKKISQAEVKLFFESLCGKVARLRLLGEYRHSTRIAFVEFVVAESAIAALNCSGAILGSLPIRVSPSKTPVRPCMARSFLI